MGSITLQNCSDTVDGQKWNAMADGRIALDLSSPRTIPNPRRLTAPVANHEVEECVDLQYMRATNNNPVGLYSCAGLGNTGAGDKGINWPLVNVTA